MLSNDQCALWTRKIWSSDHFKNFTTVARNWHKSTFLFFHFKKHLFPTLKRYICFKSMYFLWRLLWINWHFCPWNWTKIPNWIFKNIYVFFLFLHLLVGMDDLIDQNLHFVWCKLSNNINITISYKLTLYIANTQTTNTLQPNPLCFGQF